MAMIRPCLLEIERKSGKLTGLINRFSGNSSTQKNKFNQIKYLSFIRIDVLIVHAALTYAHWTMSDWIKREFAI